MPSNMEYASAKAKLPIKPWNTIDVSAEFPSPVINYTSHQGLVQSNWLTIVIGANWSMPELICSPHWVISIMRDITNSVLGPIILLHITDEHNCNNDTERKQTSNEIVAKISFGNVCPFCCPSSVLITCILFRWVCFARIGCP